MRHPNLQPGSRIALACPDRAGSPWPGPGLRGLLARLLAVGWPRRGLDAAAIRAGYALRRRQEANLQRLACPACRPPQRGDADRDSRGITAPTRADRHGTGSDMTYALAPDAVLRPARVGREASAVGAGGPEPLERAHGS